MVEKLKTGTTTVGIVTKDGVVLGTEHRATMQTFIAHKTAIKLYKIEENMGLTTAGAVGDLQNLTRYLKAEAELYKLKRKMLMPVQGAATLLSNWLNQSRYYPYWVSLILGGYDSKGYHVFGIDLAGGAIEDKYVSTGSGSLFVYGVLEDNYTNDITLDAGVDLILRGINAAIKRDAASGNGVAIATITEKEGYKELSVEEIQKKMKKLKLL